MCRRKQNRRRITFAYIQTRTVDSVYTRSWWTSRCYCFVFCLIFLVKVIHQMKTTNKEEGKKWKKRQENKERRLRYIILTHKYIRQTKNGRIAADKLFGCTFCLLLTLLSKVNFIFSFVKFVCSIQRCIVCGQSYFEVICPLWCGCCRSVYLATYI